VDYGTIYIQVSKTLDGSTVEASRTYGPDGVLITQCVPASTVTLTGTTAAVASVCYLPDTPDYPNVVNGGSDVVFSPEGIGGTLQSNHTYHLVAPLKDQNGQTLNLDLTITTPVSTCPA
jgi:hypothetical protein